MGHYAKRFLHIVLFLPLAPFTLSSLFLATFCEIVYNCDTNSFVKIAQATLI